MDISPGRIASQAVQKLTRPLVRLLLRYGIGHDEFAALIKRQYVEIAQAEFSLTRRPASKSRVALLTGLNRREVARVLSETAPGPAIEPALSPIGRIVAAWVREPAFRTSDGRPSLLSVDGEALSLEALTRSCAADIPVKTVLRELHNLKMVREHSDGRLELLTEGYLPTGSETEKLRLLGSDVAALISTIDHNLQQPQAPRFQRKVSFDHLSDEGVELLKTLVAEHGQRLLVELDTKLAPHNLQSGGHFAGLGMYQFSEQPPGETHEKS